MANSAQSKKRARQAQTHQSHNTVLRSRMRTMIKKVRSLIDQKDKENATQAFRDAAANMDSMVNKGLAHRNTIARYKSRLNKHLKDMA